MRGGVDLLESADGDLGIDLRRLEVLMAEHLLDDAKPRAFSSERNGSRMEAQTQQGRLRRDGPLKFYFWEPRTQRARLFV